MKLKMLKAWFTDLLRGDTRRGSDGNWRLWDRTGTKSGLGWGSKSYTHEGHTYFYPSRDNRTGLPDWDSK